MLEEKMVCLDGARDMHIGIKGDPSLRESAMERPRYESVVDRFLPELVERFEDMLLNRTVHRIQIGFNNGEIRISTVLDPFAEEFHPALRLLDTSYVGNIRDYLSVDLEVSSEAFNQEVRREIELMKYQLVSDFATKMAGMAQLLVNPQVPSDMKSFILDVNDKSVRLIERVLSNFDETEAGQNSIDMRDSMNVEKCVMQSIDLMPPPGAPPPGAQPGQPGQPGPPPESEQMVGMNG